MSRVDSPNKCIIVLSTKSSGSSAIQTLLARLSCIRHASYTRHREHETLYWTKAASLLGRPQIDMVDSEVPIPQARARRELVAFLTRNTVGFVPPSDPEELVFKGWEKLCEAHRPVFLEKSPHHLVQSSALQLMLDCDQRLESTAFLYIGLVRNPMDVLYSAWSRWRTLPEILQFEWELAYRNLEELRAKLGSHLVVVRYEDIIRDLALLEPVLHFVGATLDQVPSDLLHAQSLSKWKTDPHYGFRLAPSVHALATQLGYTGAELDHQPSAGWDAFRDRTRRVHRLRTTLRGPIRMLDRFREAVKHTREFPR